MAVTSFPREDIRVLLLEGVADSAVQAFRAAGYTNIDHRQTSLVGDELAEALDASHIVGIRSRTQLTADVLADARRLMAIGCFCIGTNQVDLDAAQAKGIPVFNAPYSNTRSVAELVIAEAIMLKRGIPAKNMACHRGGWLKSAAGSFEVRGKTLGIIGYGHIGTQVGVLAEAMGMRVIFFDIEPKLAMGNAVGVESMDALLAQSDIVTLHVPDTASTRMMFRAAQIDAMKSGAVLINASRGSVVDIDALADALRSEHLAGAAVDVFPVEPKGNADTFESPLVGLDNALLTPHIGGSTQEAQVNIGGEVANKIVRYSDNGSTLTAVNFPEVQLPEHEGSRRLLHIHENRPGVLSAINEVFSGSGVNVDAQYLQTRDKTGYVVIDVDAQGERAHQIRDALREVPGTLRTRLLY